MNAAGKVCIGFSLPYVGLYNFDGTTVTYTNGQRLARGVSVKINPEVSDDNEFYADNVAAESENGVFTGGTCELTVDGLHTAAERFILGLPEPEAVECGDAGSVKITKYGDSMQIPYVGIGFIAKYRSAGVTTYAPVILRRAKFQTPGNDHKTAEDTISWQTQSITADLFRDETANHEWKWVAEDQTTEAAAEAILKAVLGVPAPVKEGETA